jgi:hypothetical protein
MLKQFLCFVLKEIFGLLVSMITTEGETAFSDKAPDSDGSATAAGIVAKKQILLTSIPVTDENVALNILVSFLTLAQKRGTFTLDESAKIWECVQKFQKPS